MGLNYHVCSWVFPYCFYPLYLLGLVHHGIPWCSSPMFSHQTWRTYHDFIATGAGLFVGPLCGIIPGFFLEYFTLLCRVSGAIQQACFVMFYPISKIACMIFPALAREDLLGVGCLVRFSSLNFPYITGFFGIWPSFGFRSCCSFVDIPWNIHAFEHLTCFLVGLPLKSPALYIGLLFPAIRNGMEEDLVYFFGGDLIEGTWSGE